MADRESCYYKEHQTVNKKLPSKRVVDLGIEQDITAKGCEGEDYGGFMSLIGG